MITIVGVFWPLERHWIRRGRDQVKLHERIVIGIILWNSVVFLLYFLDKAKARHGRWRIPERVLLWISVLGGGPGAFMGMQLFRHKTRHTRFRIIIPLAAILQLTLIYVWLIKR
ncbi:MAG: DUF1294 domain-containing protein [Clostridia bacterium]|nr:DUF1294 domain-containing protein [Clostridia bacterium]